MDPATGLWLLAGQNGTDEGNGTIQRPGFVPESVPQWALDAVASVVVIVLAWLKHAFSSSCSAGAWPATSTGRASPASRSPASASASTSSPC